jgi:hypothetical protein
MYWLNNFSPRRRKLIGKQKIQYSNLNSPIKNGMINNQEKDKFIKEFNLKKKEEKKHRLILILILIGLGLITLALMHYPF